MHLQRSLGGVASLCLIAAMFLFVLPRGGRCEELRLLEAHRSALEMRLQLIDQARQSLDVAYFIIKDDCISRVFLDSLLQAANRGVCVRLIVDSMYNDMEDCVLRQLLAAGIQVKEYHPLQAAKPFKLTRRMHDKILIRDGVEMVVGSRNIEDAHFGISVEKANYLDIDLYVVGPVLGHANAYYQCLWESTQLGDLKPDRASLLTLPFRWASAPSGHEDGSSKVRRHARRVASAEPDPLENCWQRYDALMSGKVNGRPEHEPLTVPCVQLVYDPRGKKSWEMGARQSLYEILDNAQCSIVLQSPYIIPAEKLGRILRRAARRGVCIHILTNSLATTDQVLAYSAFTREAPECAQAGIQFWEYGGPNCLHAKSFVVDGHIACITTFNFDARSAFLNTELATLVDDEVFAAQLLEAMARNFDEAYPMELDGRRLVSSPELTAASTARARQSQVYGGISRVNRLPGVTRFSEGGFRLLQGVSRVIQRQL